jgi:hypothetical protein
MFIDFCFLNVLV